jgi:transcriptional repressor NrdR
MKCPYCGYQDSKVVDSRSFGDGIRRRRECLDCGARFTTHERFQAATFQVIKKDKRREEFSRDKLLAGVRKACAKRPVSNQDIERLVDQIETDLQHLGRVEVPSSVVGEMVMKHLKTLDRIAYIRFASVYRKFADVDSFQREIEDLLKGHDKDEKEAGAQLPLITDETILGRPGRPGKTEPVIRS